jgi:hypothetical protein
MDPDTHEKCVKLFNKLLTSSERDRVAAQKEIVTLSEKESRDLLRIRINDAIRSTYSVESTELTKSTDDEWTRAWLLNTLGRIADDDTKTGTIIRNHLDPGKEPSKWARYWAFKGLVFSNASDLKELALETIERDDEHRDLKMVGHAILASTEPDSMDEIKKRLKGRDKGWKRAALRALRVVPSPELMDQLIEFIEVPYWDYSVFTNEAIGCLAAYPPNTPNIDRAAEALNRFIRKNSKQTMQDGMRVRAIDALGHLKVEFVADTLVSQVVDDNPAIVRAAARALVNVIGVPYAVSRVIETAMLKQEKLDTLALALRYMRSPSVDPRQDPVVRELDSAMASGTIEKRDVVNKLLVKMGGVGAFETLRTRSNISIQFQDYMEKTNEKFNNTYEKTVDTATEQIKEAVDMDKLFIIIGPIIIIISGVLALVKEGFLESWIGAGTTGGGLAGLMYRFYASPRRQIESSLDHLMRIHVVFLAYTQQLNEIGQCFTHRILQRDMDASEIREYNGMITRIMNNAIEDFRKPRLLQRRSPVENDEEIKKWIEGKLSEP